MDLNEAKITKPEKKKRDEIRVEIPVGESRVFPDGRRYRFVAGGGCNDCAFFLPRAVSPLGAGTAETHCLATARTVAAGDPIYPCSQYSRRDGLYGHFEQVDPARNVCDFVQSETFVRRLRRFAYGVALALALIAAIAIFGAFHSALANDEVADLPAVAITADADGQTPEPIVVPAALYEPRYVETFDDVHRATCRVVCVDSTGRGAMGTGTVVGYDPDADAFEILTNYHVVQGHSTADLHFFGDGRRVAVEKAPVVATYYDEKTPIDAAILKVPRTGDLARYDPPVAPLAPAGYRPKEGAYIWSAGCSEGRWAAAWKGGVESYYGETAQFFPAPKGGQSGSAIIERTPLGLRVVAILTWRVGDDKTTGEEAMRGGAIPIAKLYEAASGRRATGEIDSIPPNAKFCASPVRYRLIYFYSKNCPGCATATPIIERLYADGYDITGVDLDAPEGLAFAERFGVRVVPSFLTIRQLTADEWADGTKSTALELWFGPDDLARRVQNSFARAAKLGVPNVAAYKAEREKSPTYSLVPAPASAPIPSQSIPTPTPPQAVPAPPTVGDETAFPVTSTTAPAYFENVAFSTEEDAATDAAAPISPEAPQELEAVAPLDSNAGPSPTELGGIAPVSRGSGDAQKLLDRYRDGFRGGNGGGADGSNEAPAEPSPSSGPIVGAIERAARAAFDQIAADATAAINEKATAFETSARRTLIATTGKIAFWGALCAAGWYWAVRILGAVATRIFQRLPRLRLEIEEPPK